MTLVDAIGTVLVSIAFVAAIVYLAKWAGEKEKAKRLAKEAAREERLAVEAKQREEAMAARRAMLLAKYEGDLDVVENILNEEPFLGETAEMLIDSLGQPLAKDLKVLKTKTKEVWKYDSTGYNQYGMRITLENGLVVSWDIKGRERY